MLKDKNALVYLGNYKKKTKGKDQKALGLDTLSDPCYLWIWLTAKSKFFRSDIFVRTILFNKNFYK
jgi:hypothetical protein